MLEDARAKRDAALAELRAQLDSVGAGWAIDFAQAADPERYGRALGELEVAPAVAAPPPQAPPAPRRAPKPVAAAGHIEVIGMFGPSSS
jgi:hypothetical protein